MTYGYMRISSKDQNEDRQLKELQAYGILEKNIFLDVASGKDFNRKQYLEMLTLLKNGDILVIKSIDRLGRNYDDILKEWRKITKEMSVNIKVLDIPLLDTTLQGKDLTGVFISDLVLQILSYVAETERENIRQRQKEGIAIAKAKGTHMGRPRTQQPKEFDIIYTKWKNKKISTKQAIQILDLKRSTFYKMVKAFKIQKSGNIEKTE